MPPPPRPWPVAKFALFFMEDPPSAEVLSTTDFIDTNPADLTEKQSCKIIRNRKAINGKIVRLGKRAPLKRLLVTMEGDVHDAAQDGVVYVGSRRTELSKLKRARQDNLDQIGNILYREGPAGLPPQAKVLRTPKQRLPEMQQKLTDEVNALPCFHPKPGDRNLMDKGVYINSVELHFLKRAHSCNPAGLFRAILKTLIPEWLLKGGGISISGKNNTVPLPANVLPAITAYVDANITGMPYCPVQVAKHYLYNHVEETQKRQRNLAAGQAAGLSAAGINSFELTATPDTPLEQRPNSSDTSSHGAETTISNVLANHRMSMGFNDH